MEKAEVRSHSVPIPSCILRVMQKPPVVLLCLNSVVNENKKPVRSSFGES